MFNRIVVYTLMTKDILVEINKLHRSFLVFWQQRSKL